MIYRIRILGQNYYHERHEDCWIVHILYSPSFEYGTRLVLYDDGRRSLEVIRPDGEDIIELTEEKWS